MKLFWKIYVRKNKKLQIYMHLYTSKTKKVSDVV